MTSPIIIIGSGLAGYQLAREFRKIDQTLPLTIVTADEGRFYSKPLLSTALTNGKDHTSLTTATAEAMATQLNATIRTHSQVTHINPLTNTISLVDEELPYAKLVLACGADVLQAPLKGDGVSEVMSINHLYHYAMFQDFIKDKKRIAILGAGLIGCEFANDLVNAGYIVDVIAPASTPLNLLIPPTIGLLLQKALGEHGVRWHLDCVVDTITKNANGLRLDLSNGETLETEFVLSAIGLIPHTALAKTAGIKTGRGIIVNRYLETSVKEIYALGDCAEVEGHVLPYITPLINCARALAKTLVGTNTPVVYPAMPVTVKTPAHPLVICPPPQGMAGTWQINGDTTDVRALFHNEKGEVYGFVLTNAAVKDRLELVKQMPGLF
jgi:rubredoxin-NAD+ reductase